MNSFDSLYDYVKTHNPRLLKKWIALREKEEGE
jgi:hypothetical protein